MTTNADRRTEGRSTHMRNDRNSVAIQLYKTERPKIFIIHKIFRE